MPKTTIIAGFFLAVCSAIATAAEPEVIASEAATAGDSWLAHGSFPAFLALGAWSAAVIFIRHRAVRSR